MFGGVKCGCSNAMRMAPDAIGRDGMAPIQKAGAYGAEFSSSAWTPLFSALVYR
jgi:hypothetical protein